MSGGISDSLRFWLKWGCQHRPWECHTTTSVDVKALAEFWGCFKIFPSWDQDSTKACLAETCFLFVSVFKRDQQNLLSAARINLAWLKCSTLGLFSYRKHIHLLIHNCLCTIAYFYRCHLLPISYNCSIHYSQLFLWFEWYIALMQSLLSETCCENNRLMRGMNRKVKGMVDVVAGLQTGSLVEAWRRVVETADGLGSW